MPGENKTLYLFTAGYPYGFKDEPFLENEIDYLASAFDKVVIFPRSKPTEEMRKTAENVFINDCLNKTPIKNKKRSLLLHPLFTLKVIISSSLSPKHIFSFWNHFRFLIDIVSIGIIQGKALEQELSNKNLSNTVFYDYWFFNSIFAISYLKTKKKISTFICRGHGYDIYEENWRTVDVPFLRFRINQVDELHLISQHGYEHICHQVSKNNFKKLNLSYLGVKKPGYYHNDLTQNETYTIVSCARVVELKRIHDIPSILKRMNVKLKWIHFGDGPYMKNLKEKLHDLPENITVELKGHVENSIVLEFYQNNPIDALISLSSSEGLPVSMMEALSYGIPIVSLDVGGISEIVKPESGLLLEKDISIFDFSKKLEKFLVNKEIERSEIIKFFDKNFNAEKNYTRFIEKINVKSF